MASLSGVVVTDSVNEAVVIGVLARNPVSRELKNGDVVLNLDVRAKTGQMKTVVPVSWVNPPAWTEKLIAGQRVAVRGSVRQLWYANNAHFTDLFAQKVVRISGPGSYRKFLEEFLGDLEDDLESSVTGVEARAS